MATESKHTVKPSGGDYTTLSGWEAGEQADLVTADIFAVAEIDGTWSSAETGGISVNGWTTDATRYIEIRTTTTARHDGKWKDTAYRITHSGSVLALCTYEDFTRLIGLQIHYSGTYQYANGIATSGLSDGASFLVDSCIVRATLSGATHSNYGIGFNYYASGSRTGEARNCLVYDYVHGTDVTRGFHRTTGWTVNWRNCTAHNCYQGFYNGTPTNCLAQNCSDGFVSASGGDYNCSDVASDAPGANSQTGDVSFVDEANDDFHLASGDTLAKDHGTDLSAYFTTDIDGATRSGSWDIGADEYTSGGTANPVTGLIEAATTLAAAVTLAIALAASTASASTVSGQATVTRAAVAAVSAASTVTGSAAIGRPGSGAIAAASTVTGQALANRAAAGAIAAQSTVAGEATVSSAGGVTGQIDSASTVAGVPTIGRAVAGAIAAQAAAAGSPSMGRAVTGTAGALSTVTGALSQGYAVAGTIAAASTVAGDAAVLGPFVYLPNVYTPSARRASATIPARATTWTPSARGTTHSTA